MLRGRRHLEVPCPDPMVAQKMASPLVYRLSDQSQCSVTKWLRARSAHESGPAYQAASYPRRWALA